MYTLADFREKVCMVLWYRKFYQGNAPSHTSFSNGCSDVSTLPSALIMDAHHNSRCSKQYQPQHRVSTIGEQTHEGLSVQATTGDDDFSFYSMAQTDSAKITE